tara:strand:- start:799 stop:978 length:180 start_codon:yes stop_codon:yes gene_type:complete
MSSTYKHDKHNILFDKDDIVLVTFETFLGVVVVMTLSAHDKIEDKKHINTIWDNLSIYI